MGTITGHEKLFSISRNEKKTYFMKEFEAANYINICFHKYNIYSIACELYNIDLKRRENK